MKIHKITPIGDSKIRLITTSRNSIILYSIEECQIMDTLTLKEDIKEFKYDDFNKLVYILTCDESGFKETSRNSSRRRMNSRRLQRSARTRTEDLKGITEVFSSTSKRSIVKNKVLVERESKFNTPRRSRKSSNRVIEKNTPKYSIKIFKIEDNERFSENPVLSSYPLSEEFEFTTFDISPKNSVLVITGYKKILRNQSRSKSKKDKDQRSKSKVNVDKLAIFKGNKSLNVTNFSRTKSYHNALFLYKISKNGRLCYSSGRDILFNNYDNSGQVNYIKVEETKKREVLNIIAGTNKGLNIFGFELLVEKINLEEFLIIKI